MIETVINLGSVVALLLVVYFSGLALHELAHYIAGRYYTQVHGAALAVNVNSWKTSCGAFVATEETNRVIRFAPILWFVPYAVLRFYGSGSVVWTVIATAFGFAGLLTLLSDVPNHFGMFETDYTELTIYPVVERTPFEEWDPR